MVFGLSLLGLLSRAHCWLSAAPERAGAPGREGEREPAGVRALPGRSWACLSALLRSGPLSEIAQQDTGRGVLWVSAAFGKARNNAEPLDSCL